MAFLESEVTDLFESIKSSQVPVGRIAVNGADGYFLEPIRKSSDLSLLVPTLAKWRQENIQGFTKIFKVTNKGTRIWIEKGLLERKDRILFIVTGPDNKCYGHVGLSSFNFHEGSCEIDNIVRGEPGGNDLFYHACNTLIEWARENFPAIKIGLRVLNNNIKALALYHRMGFVPVEMIALKKIESEGETEWIAIGDENVKSIDRFFIRMSLLD